MFSTTALMCAFVLALSLAVPYTFAQPEHAQQGRSGPPDMEQRFGEAFEQARKRGSLEESVSITPNGRARITGGDVESVSGHTLTVSVWGFTFTVGAKDAQLTGGPDASLSDLQEDDPVMIVGDYLGGGQQIDARVIHSPRFHQAAVDRILTRIQQLQQRLDEMRGDADTDQEANDEQEESEETDAEEDANEEEQESEDHTNDTDSKEEEVDKRTARRAIDDTDGLISDVNNEIEEAERDDEEVDTAQDLIREADDTIEEAKAVFNRDKDYARAKELADQAERTALDAQEAIRANEKARDAIEDADNAIEDARQEIRDANEDEENVDEAQNLLDNARALHEEAEDAFDDDDFVTARDKAEAAQEKANDAEDAL